VRTLPNQDGGLTNELGQFVISGKYLAWDDTVLIDPVAPVDDYVSVMNVASGRVPINQAFAWPDQNSGNNNVSVSAIVLAPDGAVVWLSGLAPIGGGPTSAYSVVRIGSDGTQSTLAQGTNISGWPRAPTARRCPGRTTESPPRPRWPEGTAKGSARALAAR
jgi:hypothetical protein